MTIDDIVVDFWYWELLFVSVLVAFLFVCVLVFLSLCLFVCFCFMFVCVFVSLSHCLFVCFCFVCLHVCLFV